LVLEVVVADTLHHEEDLLIQQDHLPLPTVEGLNRRPVVVRLTDVQQATTTVVVHHHHHHTEVVVVPEEGLVHDLQFDEREATAGVDLAVQ